MELKSDIPLGGGTNVPPVDNQVTMGHPVAPKVYFQAPGMALLSGRVTYLVSFFGTPGAGPAFCFC